MAVAGLVAAAVGAGGIVQAKPLGQATVTQVNNDVRFKPATGEERPAKTKDVVKGADTVRTGQKSQTELEFEDHTITRLGSNSTFTFDPEKREFQLKKGLLLFDMPKGNGGGKIITPAGTAAIEGTAGIVSYRSAPKIMCLAGVINVLNPNGQLLAKVMPGQLFIVGVTKYPVDFMLNGLKTGKLMKGGLPNNTQEFDNSNNNQQSQVQSGVLQPTPFVMLGENNNVFVATATTSQNQYTQGTQEQTSSLSQTSTTPPPPFVIDSSTTIDASAGSINNTTTGQKHQGSTQSTSATFDFGSQDVTVTGNPQTVPTASGSMNATFTTQGTLTFQNMPEDTSSGSTPSTGDLLTFNASTINFNNSTFKAGGLETSPSSLQFFATSDLLVDPSTLKVRSGPTDGTNPYGLLHLESAAGQLAFAGNGYDPVNDPSDLLRSHASATINAGSGVYDGGTIQFIENGSGMSLINGVIVPNCVSIYDATLDASAKNNNGYMTSGSGGKVQLSSLLLVNIADTVDIAANGASAGSITIDSPGTATALGYISMKVPNSTGHITLSAEPLSSGFYGFPSSDGGSINLLGNVANSFSIWLSASGPAGGGTIVLNAYGLYYSQDNWANGIPNSSGINLQYASLDVSPTYYNSSSAGAISLQAPQININHSQLFAGSYSTSEGSIGQIKINAVNPSGTYLGTQVSIGSSSLFVGGLTVDPYSGIQIFGDTVTVDKPGAFYAGAAQVHIESRLNTGFTSSGTPWSTDSQASVYWTPLYFILDDSLTLNSGNPTVDPKVDPNKAPNVEPTITGLSGTLLTGTFENNVAVFDFGSQNVLLWPHGPHSSSTASGIFEAEFRTSGSFEALDLTPGGSGDSGPKTDHISIHAAGIQIVNSTFDMSGSVNGPAQFQLFSTTDLVVTSPYDLSSPSTLAPESGKLYKLDTGGLLHLESAGVTALGGNDNSRITYALTGATDVGGTIEIISTGDGTGAGGTTEGVHIRNAVIDASHSFPTDGSPLIPGSTPPTQGGTVTVDGTQQVTIQDTTTINADGQQTAGSISVTSEGTSYQAGKIDVSIDNGGSAYLSAQNLSITKWSAPSDGSIGIFGADVSDGSKTVTFTATGPAGGGLISIAAPDSVMIGAATLDVSALPGSGKSGGTISGSAGGSQFYLTDAILKADGSAAGNIRLQTPQAIAFEANDSTDYVRLSAQDAATAVATPTAGGNIDLLGAASRASGNESIQLLASVDGDTVNLSAVGINLSAAGSSYSPTMWLGSAAGLGGINIRYARLDASAASGSGLEGGWISLRAPQINLANATILADADGTAIGGVIAVHGQNPNNTYLGTSVSIAGSTLSTLGSSGGTLFAGSDSGILIEADKVTVDASSSLKPDQSLVHIMSRENTGGWSPDPGNPINSIYWSPLYQVMMDNDTTIDLSGSTPTISTTSSKTPFSPIYGTGTGPVVFDFGSQNVLVWPQSPLCIANAGTFDVELRTSSTFEAQDVTITTPSESSFSRVVIGASGMQFLNTTFDIGSSGAADGAGQLVLSSSSDLMIASPPDASGAAPSTLIVHNSADDFGGTISLQSTSGGQVSFVGNSLTRLAQAYAGAKSVGGTFFVSGDGYSFSDSGPINGVYIRDALIDVSHPFNVINGMVTLEPTPAGQGGTVQLNGKYGVAIQDTTICADGGNAGSIQVVGSAVSLSIGNSAGSVRLSAQDAETASTSPTASGDIDLLGAASRALLDNNESIQLIGNSGGSITVESLGDIHVLNSSLNASIYSAAAGSISLLAPGTLSLQNVSIDASSYNGEGGSFAGGRIILGTQPLVADGSQINWGNGNARIAMNESVDIRADGGLAAGVIRITSTGNSSHSGSVIMNIPDANGYIYASAQVSPSSIPNGGDIQLLGVNESSDESLKILATGNTGGGSIQINAAGNITIQEADISTPVLETLGLPAGQIAITAANNLQIQDSYLDASPGKPDNFISSGPNLNDAGGSITLSGGSSVTLKCVTDWLTITADGPNSTSPKATAAGQIIVESPGSVTISTDNSSGYVRLSALDSQVDFDNKTHYGEIDLLGSGMRSSGNESVQVVSSGSSGGGTIDIEAAGSETLINAALDVSAPSSATASAGTATLHATASVEMNGARVDASSYSTAAQGGTVNIQGDSVNIQGTPVTANGVSQGGSTTVTADGPTAGTINVQASSPSSTSGNVTIANNDTHFVRLSAQDSATVFNALSTGGNIDIIGASGRSSGNETVQIVASGPAGSGNIAITAAQDLNIVNAQLNASGNISLVAIQNLSAINAQLNASGAINLQGQNVLVQNSALTAALISINAYSSASILNSILTAPYINIYSPTVDFTGSTLNGNAQVYGTITHQPVNVTIVPLPYQPKP